MAFADDFTGSDDDLLEDRTGWSIVTDGGYRFTILSNQITPRAGGGGSGRSMWICTDQGSADHYTQVRIKTFQSASDTFHCCRLVDIDNFICSYCPGLSDVGYRLMKMVANTPTDLVTFQGADEDLIKVTCEGNTIKIYKNGAQQGGDQTVTDHNTETSQGFIVGEALGGLAMRDDWEAGPMVQYARPDSDITKGNWDDPNGNNNDVLFDDIDEVVASDADYIESPDNPSAEVCEVGLSDVDDPLGNTDHFVRIRYQAPESGGGGPADIDFTIALMEGAVERASWIEQPNPPSVWATVEKTLSSGEADSITDYTDLRLRFTANKTGGARTTNIDVSWAELEVPLPAGEAPTFIPLVIMII